MMKTSVYTAVTAYSHMTQRELKVFPKAAMRKGFREEHLVPWINPQREALCIHIEEGAWRILIESRRDGTPGANFMTCGNGDDKTFRLGTTLNYLQDAIRQVKDLAEYYYKFKATPITKSMLGLLPSLLDLVLEGCPLSRRNAKTKPFILSFDCIKYVLAAISLTKLYNDLCGQCGRPPMEYPDFSFIRTTSGKYRFTPAEAERHAQGLNLFMAVPAAMSGDNGAA